MSDPLFDHTGHIRDAQQMRKLATTIHTLKNIPRRKGEAERLETKYGLHANLNPLWDLPYGANPAGIYGACPPELLHQYQLGIMKYAYQFTWARINGSSPVAGTAKTATAMRVDDRFKGFADRHADPELPRNKFRKGVYDLPYLQGKEYRALLMQVCVCVCVCVCAHTTTTTCDHTTKLLVFIPPHSPPCMYVL
jgi:hypothetical protein